MNPDPNVLTCPECGEPMKRDRRILVEGRTPFRCANGHMAVDDNEPVQFEQGHDADPAGAAMTDQRGPGQWTTYVCPDCGYQQTGVDRHAADCPNNTPNPSVLTCPDCDEPDCPGEWTPHD